MSGMSEHSGPSGYTERKLTPGSYCARPKIEDCVDTEGLCPGIVLWTEDPEGFWSKLGLEEDGWPQMGPS
jgi:hypothetical protein